MGQLTNRSCAWFILLMGALGFLAALPSAAQSDGACEEDDSHRALDFLLGEWQLVSDGEAVGRSLIEKLEDGCLIAETWSFADGRSGRTYSFLDRAANVWRRFSVSNRGVVIRSSGAVEGSALLVRGERTTADGETSNWRERLAPEAGGRISRVAGHSTAGGRSDRAGSAAFEGYYLPVGEPVEQPSSPAEPSSPPTAPADTAPRPTTVEAEPAPAPVEPQPAPVEREQPASPTPSEPGAAPVTGEVTPDSARAADAANIERIAMASPMVLRLPLGTVEALPTGYAWTTRDTEPYLCEGVTIERLEVARRQRRGRVELQVELALHSAQISKRVDVEIDLLRAGQGDQDAAVASGSASGRVGRGIPAQIQYGAVALTVSLPMTVEAFDAAVADAERPELLITLAVAK